jgi:hypothetical protein
MMKPFTEWFRTTAATDPRPWLILGKGPTFGRRGEFDLSAYRLLSLNHVVRELPVEVAHIIDLDVVEACGEALLAQAGVLVMPWYPHVRNRVGRETLEALVPGHRVLSQLAAEGRLLWYNLSTGRTERPGSPVVPVSYFSAEAALGLLALSGARVVRSLGVDGGAAYSASFDDLKDTTRLNNGHPSYNLQFAGFARIIMTTGVDYSPLTIESPVRVYVGSQEAQMLAVKVLEHSIRKHASLPVEVMPLHHADIQFPTPRDVKNRPRTPFSFQRFTIPQLAGFRGRAIYVDSDMQVFRDIREIWTLPFDGAQLLAAREPGDSGRRPQFSVMLLDCAALPWNPQSIVDYLDRGEFTYEQLMYEMKLATSRADIPSEWNSLERYEEGRTGLLHYTDMTMQPWISTANPRAYLWVRGVLEAVEQGVITRDYIAEHVRLGYVRPSLLAQVDERKEEPATLSRAALALDDGYLAPYQKMGPHGTSGTATPLGRLKARLRHLYEHSLVKRAVRRLGSTHSA